MAASLVVGGAMAGCKKSGDASIAQMTELKTKMCACKDKACIDQVSADMAKWSAAHRGTAPEQASADDQKKLAAISTEMTDCMTRVMREVPAAAGAAAGSADSGSGAAGSGSDGASAAGSGEAGGSSAGAGAGLPPHETMAHRAGMCPSTVLGATTKAAQKGKSVVVTIAATDKDAIAAIQKRADHLLAEKHNAPSGTGHDMKGTHGGSQGLCPVYVPDGSKATAKHDASGVVVTITPKDKPDDLAKEIDGRIAKAADWVKTNVKEGDQGNQGGVGGGKGDDGSNHSGKGDGKGRDRKKGVGGGKGTGGGGGAGTGKPG
ncbi:MAG TPA: hypothetical protein VLM79_15980 [Kofleriaceae bacterium]|nr:hypothetical protein [Kofleriaceae bacterium]